MGGRCPAEKAGMALLCACCAVGDRARAINSASVMTKDPRHSEHDWTEWEMWTPIYPLLKNGWFRRENPVNEQEKMVACRKRFCECGAGQIQWFDNNRIDDFNWRSS